MRSVLGYLPQDFGVYPHLTANVVYFFLFIIGISVVAILYGVKVPLLDWLGFGLFKESMAAVAHSAYPDYQGGLTLSMVPPSAEILPFNWSGVTWALPVILPRLAMYAVAIGLALLGALFFDRFDTSRARRRGRNGQFASPDSALGLSAKIPGAASRAIQDLPRATPCRTASASSKEPPSGRIATGPPNHALVVVSCRCRIDRRLPARAFQKS